MKGLFSSSFFEPTLKYSDAKSYSYEIRETYSLNLGDDKTYEEYEKVLQDFYFNKYSKEIISQKENPPPNFGQ